MRLLKRIFQYATGFHRIHHIKESYGFKIPFINYGYFDKNGIQKIDKMYHNCTVTEIY